MDFEPIRRIAGPYVRWCNLVVARYTRGMTLGVRGIVFDAAGRVLLIQHRYSSGWQFPGGGVDAGETVREALTRELKEEANVTLTAPARLHGVFFNRRVSRRDHVFAFVVREWRQETAPKPSLEILEHRFFAPTDLPANTTAGTRARLAEVLDGASVSENW